MIVDQQQADRSQIAAQIEENPAAAYSVASGADWGFGMVRWIPDHMQAGLARYVLLGVRPGSFLTATLENDLLEAGRKADDENRRCLFHYVMFLINYAPVQCFGSLAAVDHWTRTGGLIGHPEQGSRPC